MSTQKPTIIYTLTDEAPRLGVSDFLCVRRFSPEVSFSEPA